MEGSGFRVVRKRKKVDESSVCHLDNLTYEQVSRVPTKGQIFIMNRKGGCDESGRYNAISETRGCYRVIDDTTSKIFIVCEEFRSENYTGKVCLLRSDFYCGLAVAKIVDRPYYKTGKNALSWEEFDVANF